tara:strand:- start:1057 stop:2205 length:1149 start_codon:yes stop_codon:yes gene_type:complete
MLRFINYFFLIIFLINVLIYSSGKTWIYKAISITYLKGFNTAYIHDFPYFPSNIIDNGDSQEWLISKNYNEKSLPKFINKINTTLETVSFLVIKSDSIIFEQYWHGYSADTVSNSFSMAKSLVSTLIGVALKENNISSLDQTVCDFIPKFCVDKNKHVTIRNLLTQSSGLDWNEDYHNPIGQTAEAYYGTNLKHLMLNLKSIEPGGKIFRYHSASTQLLAFILEEATGQTISEYASQKLWKKIGARNQAYWSKDSEDGDEKAFCCIYSNARDFARLGKLYLNNGIWNGVRIIDDDYVNEATNAADLINKKGKKNINYGYQFWITNYKNMHIFYAKGFSGQYMICIPEKDMIIVRLGRKSGNQLENGNHDDFYNFIDAALSLI